MGLTMEQIYPTHQPAAKAETASSRPCRCSFCLPQDSDLKVSIPTPFISGKCLITMDV